MRCRNSPLTALILPPVFRWIYPHRFLSGGRLPAGGPEYLRDTLKSGIIQ